MKAIPLFDQKPNLVCTFYYSLLSHMIIIALLLSIPLRSGGAGSALAKGFFISLNTEEHALTTGKSQRTATTGRVTPPETSEQAQGGTDSLEQNTSSLMNTEEGTPSYQEKSEPKFAEAAGKNKPLPAASPVETARNSLEGKDDKPQAAEKEKPVIESLRKGEAVVGNEKSDLKSLSAPLVQANASPDTQVGLKTKQPLSLVSRDALPPAVSKKPLDDSSDKKPAQPIRAPSAALPQLGKQSITMMEESPAKSLRKEETLTDKKEKAGEKTATLAAVAVNNRAVQEKNSPAPPVISQNAQPEIAPAMTAAKESSSPALEGKIMPTPPAEVSPETVAPAPAAKALVQDITDASNYSSPDKQTEQNLLPKITSIDLRPSHDTREKSAVNQGITESAPPLKTQPDHGGTTKTTTPETKEHQDKSLPLPAVPEAATKIVSAPHPEPPAKIDAAAKPLAAPASSSQQTSADTTSDKEKTVIRVSDAATVSSALPGVSRIFHKDQESSPAKSNGSITEPSPERQGNPDSESNEKNAPGDTATKAAPGKAVPSAITTSEIPASLPSPDKQLHLPSTPPRGISRAADISARLAAPRSEMSQPGKDQLNPATLAKGDEEQSEIRERQGIPLPEVLLSKDIQVEIYLTGSGIPSVFTRFTKKPYPVPSRKDPTKKEEEVHYTARTKLREMGEPGIRLILSVASAEKGIYSFAIENKGKEVYAADVLFHLYEGREKARTKEYRNIPLHAGASYGFKFVLPDTIFWDDDVFSVVMEDSKHITKVQDTSGLVWKEEKEPAVSNQPATSLSLPVPALLKAP